MNGELSSKSFLDASLATRRRLRNPLLGYGNTLPAMKKKNVRDVLASNLAHLMSQSPDLSSGPKLAKASGVTQKTINNIVKGRHDPKLTSVEKIAKVFGVEAHQLLCPAAEQTAFLAVCRAYNETDDRGREILNATAEALLPRVSKAGASNNQ